MNVGMVLVCEHGVTGQAHLLCTLDLSVPISALNQAAHQLHIVLARHSNDVCHHSRCTGLVGLNGQAKARPIGQVSGNSCHDCIEYAQ